ncbi:probable cytochrome P450 6a14 [Adelges cooleyi]|uniref:probable cytochrome P450 6a14 n=1 Tax=Adelges cooleyi TaxID=133065 RepID=UPI002180434C|nr:probable cytochrome P450 6a14 [Adelges cooleyi]
MSFTVTSWSLQCTVVLLVVLACSAFVYYYTYVFAYWRKRNVPHVTPAVPLFGNVFRLTLGLDNLAGSFDRMYKLCTEKKYIGYYQMKTPTLIVCDPEIVQTILVKDFSHFTDRWAHIDIESTPFANNLFHMKGSRWKAMRNKISPVFTSRMLRNMHDQIEDCSGELLRNVQSDLELCSDSIEVRHVMGNYSTDVIGTCAFGLQLNAISDKDSPFRQAGKAIFNPPRPSLLKQTLLTIVPRLNKLLKITPWPAHLTDFFINAFKDTMKYREDNNISRNDLVQCLMQARTDFVINKIDPSVNFTEVDIIANAFIMFAAGFETVSTTMSYCLYELALNKTIQDRVRKEMLVAKTKHNGETNSELLTDLSYLGMVIAETLRKYPPTLVLMRSCTSTYQVPGDNLIIEKGTRVLIPVYSIQMDLKYFTDPTTFNPERFAPENKSKLLGGTYIPFGDGPRHCIGKRFAEMEMKLALTELLSKYEVEPCEKTQIPIVFAKRTPMAIPEKGIWLKFKAIDC